MTFIFTCVVVGWLAAWTTVDVLQHQWGYAVFNGCFGLVGAFCAYREWA